MTGKPGLAPICPYCDRAAELVGGDVIYPNRPDLAVKSIWRCQPCGAWVGCHPGTFNPLGRLADAELRRAKERAHAAFDPLWRRKIEREKISRTKARRAGYAWLAKKMGMGPGECHIGEMDVEQCARVVEICAPYRRK